MDAETFLPCDAGELEKLLLAQSALRRKLLMYTAGFGITAYLWWSYPILPMRVMLGLLGLFQLSGLLLLASRYKAYGQDLQDGRKKITPGVVEHKERFDTEGARLDPSRPVFFLRVNGQEAGVTEEVYRQFKEGDQVGLCQAPHSLHILGVRHPDGAS
jgi:hypothetical protein